MKEYYVSLSGSRIDSNGRKSRYGTAFINKASARTALAKAKMYYTNTYRDVTGTAKIWSNE
jgi:hypothetical protein